MPVIHAVYTLRQDGMHHDYFPMKADAMKRKRELKAQGFEPTYHTGNLSGREEICELLNLINKRACEREVSEFWERLD